MSHTESKINLTHVFGALFNSKLLHLWTLTGDKKKKKWLKKISAPKTDKCAAKDYENMQWFH